MNPIDVAWLVLKNDPDDTIRQPQQPTLTDFMGYTRHQLEQLLVMFQNELIRRGHPSGTSEVHVPNVEPYMTGNRRDAPVTQVPTVRPVRYDEELVVLDEDSPTHHPSHQRESAEIYNRLVDMGVAPSVIQPEHIEQYQEFLRTYGRPPSPEELQAHVSELNAEYAEDEGL